MKMSTQLFIVGVLVMHVLAGIVKVCGFYPSEILECMVTGICTYVQNAMSIQVTITGAQATCMIVMYMIGFVHGRVSVERVHHIWSWSGFWDTWVLRQITPSEPTWYDANRNNEHSLTSIAQASTGAKKQKPKK